MDHAKKRYETQGQMGFLSIEQLVPHDHLLRKIHKMLFIDYLFGIRSGRQLVKEVEVNCLSLAFRGWLAREGSEPLDFQQEPTAAV